MQRILSVILALALVLCAGSVISVKADTLTEGIYNYTVENNEATLTGCTKDPEGNVVLPSTLGGYPVTKIGYRAFSYALDLTGVTLPDTLKEVDSYGFYNCHSLTYVEMGDNVTTLGEYSFTDCYNLSYVKLSNQLRTIKNGAFSGCTALRDLTIPKTVESIGWASFYNCPSLNIYRNGFYIGTEDNPYYGFVEPTSQTLSTCRIHEDTKVIFNVAFRYFNVKQISIGTSVERICKDAFSASFMLTDVYYAGTQAQWDQIVIEESNLYLTRATMHFEETLPAPSGDLDGTDAVDEDDVIYLLQHLLMPEDFPVELPVDYDNSSTVDEDDVIYLLQHLLMPEDFPL